MKLKIDVVELIVERKAYLVGERGLYKSARLFAIHLKCYAIRDWFHRTSLSTSFDTLVSIRNATLRDQGDSIRMGEAQATVTRVTSVPE